MSEHVTYVANGGQTYQPCQDNVNVPFASYEKPAKPNPLLPELELNQDAIDKGYVLPSQKQHFLPGVTSEMMDWFWANMEKGYYPKHVNRAQLYLVAKVLKSTDLR